MRLRFRLGDLVAVAIVFLIAAVVAFLFLPKETASGQVEVYQNGQLVHSFALSENRQFSVSGAYINEIEIVDGKVFFAKSNCPGQDCVHSGGISASGRSLVCLPNGVEIRIVAKNDEIDFVVG